MQKIAIIEDEPDIQQMYRFRLELEGYKVQVAYDGVQGLAVVRSFRPDLVLLDLRMPVMSGDVMLERMRSEDWGSSARVIILTNISRDEAPQKLRFLNVDRYIVKAHHTPAQIVQIVREILD